MEDNDVLCFQCKLHSGDLREDIRRRSGIAQLFGPGLRITIFFVMIWVTPKEGMDCVNDIIMSLVLQNILFQPLSIHISPLDMLD